MTFAGFPSRAQATAIPNVFFSDVLPKLADDPAAVGVALYAFNVLMRKRGFPRYVTAGELISESGMVAFLRHHWDLSTEDTKGNRGPAGNSSVDAEARGLLDVAERGLERCTAVGMLLELPQVSEGRDKALYFLNAPADRRAMETVRAEGVARGRIVPFRPALAEKKGVFALYEQEIGTLTPQIVEQLTEAEQLYPAEWLERAFREAAAQNARSWRYVQRILERWAIEGADHATGERDQARGERYFQGKYGRILRERDAT